MYLELSTFPDLESNPGPFDLEPIALTVIPPCIGCLSAFFQMKQAKKKLVPEFVVGFGAGAGGGEISGLRQHFKICFPQVIIT